MEQTDTDTLRKLAPCWTLAGDERLLTILQSTHQRLVAKCQEANSQLEHMASALDDANITLQNVNNQFMALSSSQFVERRVYDDDVDVAAEPPPAKEPPKLSPPDELSILKRSIAVIEKTHEVITILQDSDTESDTDDEMPDRLVMKPKDMYPDRPLPYIIGSEPWKNKWHAGLMPEDSDTDSSTSKVGRESDQYSQSEPEDFELVNSSKVQDIPETRHVRKVSDTSSDLPSEPTPDTKPTPSDVASELARRLGGGDPPPKVVEQEPEHEEPSKPVVRKVYKSQEPIASTIFPDDPPPLEYQTDSDTDIFADLHRNQPYNQPYSRHQVSDQLFGGNETENEDGGDIFSDFAKQPTTKPVSIFEAGPTPHMFDNQHDLDVKVERLPEKNPDTSVRSVEQPSAPGTEDVKSVKKPVGGISLFGSNKGAENIGAAILKRNRRKSYTSSEESSSETPSHTSPIKNQKELQAKKEKDIFDDLFAKSETKKTPKRNNLEKNIKQDIPKQKEEIQKKDTPKSIDLFSDNLFDDIDDIFTTNVVKDSKDKSKSIFEDDDDLFSEVAGRNTVVHQTTKNTKNDKKGLFDSDDDLFAENVPKNKPNVSNESQSATKVITNPIKANEPSIISAISSKNNEKAAVNTTITSIPKGKASIFDDESDENDIFSTVNTNIENSKAQHSSVAKNIDTSKNIYQSPLLFDDDGDLFTDRNKIQKNVQNIVTDKEFKTSTLKPETVVNVAEKDNTDDQPFVEASNKPDIESESYKNNRADDNKTLISSKNNEKAAVNTTIPSIPKGKASIFDDDSDENDIFSTVNTNNENSKAQNNSVAKNVDTFKNIYQSPLLFDDDADLFTDRNKIQKNVQNIVNIAEKDNTDDQPFVEASNKPDIEEGESYKNNRAVDNKTLLDTPNSKTKPEITESSPVKSIDVRNDRKDIDNNDLLKHNVLTKTDVFEEPKLITYLLAEDTAKDTEDKTNERNSSFEDNIDDSLSNVTEGTESVIIENFNINSKSAEVQKLFADTTTNYNLKKEEFKDEFVEESKKEIPKNKTTKEIRNQLDESTPNINIHDILKQTPIFDDSSLEKHIFASPNNVTRFEEPIMSNIDKSQDINTIPDAEIFADIISEPPDFEKPKEPKKSRNVNALFDDDSDDETLFFKRDDVITDEKPEDFTAKQDRLFDMFVSEPPDEDFTNINDDLFSTMPKPELPGEQIEPRHVVTNDDYNILPTFNDIPNVSETVKSEMPPDISNSKENTENLVGNKSEFIESEPFRERARIFNDNNNMFKQSKTSISKKSENLLSEDYDDDDELFKSLPIQLPGTYIESKPRMDDEPDEPFMSLPPNLDREISNEFRKPPSNFKLPSEPTDSNSRSEVKKVGKLKLGLNINVNALLPGASPKKIKQVDIIDGQTQSQVEIPKAEPISFEGEPEPKILDSKPVKERPRIQVKRRPSTRKARIEAVRKSGIDFGDDSTDNSSSLDDAPKKEKRPDIKVDEKISNNDIEQATQTDINIEEKYEENQEVQIENTESENPNVKNEIPIDVSNESKDKTEILASQTIIEPTRPPVKSDSTTKIVYILNDEDIFNTTKIEDPLNKTNISTNQSALQDQINIEKEISNTADSHLNLSTNSESGIKTLGKTYQSTKSDESKKSKSLFGEDEESDDEEIFRNKKPTVKSTIFDSDSEGELFGAPKKVDNIKTVEKVIKEVKGPLFGNDDDDDDLFGVKTSKPAESQQPTKSSSVKETPKLTEPVFEDPLSMFGDD